MSSLSPLILTEYDDKLDLRSNLKTFNRVIAENKIF